MNNTRWIFLMILGILTTGCSSKSNFYQLHPKQTHATNTTQSTKSTIIGIAGVDIAGYLTKSALVTRINAGRLTIHETDLWADSLNQNIQAVLKENMTSLLPRYTFLNYPWEEPIEDKYRIYVTINHFDGSLNTRTVSLEGRWSLINKEENQVLYTESFYYTEESNRTLEGIVNTQSILLEKLSHRMAKKIGNLSL